jgi:hypothetical protein
MTEGVAIIDVWDVETFDVAPSDWAGAGKLFGEKTEKA